MWLVPPSSVLLPCAYSTTCGPSWQATNPQHPLRGQEAAGGPYTATRARTDAFMAAPSDPLTVFSCGSQREFVFENAEQAGTIRHREAKSCPQKAKWEVRGEPGMSIRNASPNILVILTDQHRFDCLGCMGHRLVKTPNVDRLAEEGCIFTNAYTPSPICSPARAALFTGMYPPAAGVVDNWCPFRGDVTLVTDRLQHAGYQTAEVGKLHFVPQARRFGFQYKRLHDALYDVYADDHLHSDYLKFLRKTAFKDDPEAPVRMANADESSYGQDNYRFILGSNWRDEEHHSTTWAAREAVRYLQSRDRNSPFFLFVGYFGPHQPFEPPAPWNQLYRPEDVPLPQQFHAGMEESPIFQRTRAGEARRNKGEWDELTFRKILSAYFGGVTMIDYYTGQIFDCLREEGTWDDTMVVFTADHGDHNAQYGLFFKGDMYDSCAKVPMIIKPPHPEGASGWRDEVVNLLDLFATICEAAGDMECSGPYVESRSLWPLLTGTDYGWENETYSIFGPDPGSALTMARKGQLKLIRLERGLKGPLYEMYDLNDEVPEVRNVYHDPSYALGRDALRHVLDAWSERQKANYSRPDIEFRNR